MTARLIRTRRMMSRMAVFVAVIFHDAAFLRVAGKPRNTGERPTHMIRQIVPCPSRTSTTGSSSATMSVDTATESGNLLTSIRRPSGGRSDRYIGRIPRQRRRAVHRRSRRCLQLTVFRFVTVNDFSFLTKLYIALQQNAYRLKTNDYRRKFRYDGERHADFPGFTPPNRP